MKRFHEQFKDRVDMYDGSVVLREDEYLQIVHDAYKEGQQDTMKWVSEECRKNTERLTSGAWLDDFMKDAKRAGEKWMGLTRK